MAFGVSRLRPQSIAGSFTSLVALFASVALSGCGSDSNDGGEAGSGGNTPQAGGGSGGTEPEAGAGGDEPGGSGGTTGGAAGSAGVGGDPSPPACDPTASTLGVIEVPNPLVSIGLEVTASGVNTPTALVDGNYGNQASFGAPTEAEPSFVAFPLSGAPTRLLLVWADAGATSPYDDPTGAPGDYRIETSPDSTDGSDGTWSVAATVVDNAVKSRGHSFGVDGASWVRFVVTAVPEGASSVVLSEIALYDVSGSGDARPQDTWAFFGDSITQGAFGRNLGPTTRFDAHVTAAHEAFVPAMINGGIGAEFARDGADRIGEFLELNPDFQFIAIGYGTNDSWGNQASAASFETSLRAIIQAVLDDGRVPVLARIPFATVAHSTLPVFNAVIDELSTEFGLPCGPDLYGWFRDNPAELSPDGVHPATAGYRSMNRVWADLASGFYVDP